MLQLPALDGRKHGSASCSVEEAVPIIEALNVDFEIGVTDLGVVLLEFGARFGLVIDRLRTSLAMGEAEDGEAGWTYSNLVDITNHSRNILM